MSSAISQDTEPLGRQFYSRKEKSLGILVSNFLRLYNRDDVDLIGLDDAAAKLGVERRRIYDVVNILESIGLIVRMGKNLYSWKGFGEIPRSLAKLKEEGLKENVSITNLRSSGTVPNVDESETPLSLTPDDQENSSCSKLDKKKEKSLFILAQNFVKLFLCSDVELIGLDTAAKALLSESLDPLNMRTKVRRLYDIANVFSSMNLIEKTHIQETRKPAYKWLGWKGISKSKSLASAAAAAASFDLNEPKKRVFGTEITNLSSKRDKSDVSSNQKENLCGKNDSENTYSMNNKVGQQHSKPNSKKFVFGPFSPTGASRNKSLGNNNARRTQVLETLASTYEPKYCNQALTGLLGHYMEAWNSWYAEFARK